MKGLQLIKVKPVKNVSGMGSKSKTIMGNGATRKITNYC